jgi:hypothetical protein
MIDREFNLVFLLNIFKHKCFIPFGVLSILILCFLLFFIYLQFHKHWHLKELSLANEEISFRHLYNKLILFIFLLFILLDDFINDNLRWKDLILLLLLMCWSLKLVMMWHVLWLRCHIFSRSFRKTR